MRTAFRWWSGHDLGASRCRPAAAHAAVSGLAGDTSSAAGALRAPQRDSAVRSRPNLPLIPSTSVMPDLQGVGTLSQGYLPTLLEQHEMRLVTCRARVEEQTAFALTSHECTGRVLQRGWGLAAVVLQRVSPAMARRHSWHTASIRSRGAQDLRGEDGQPSTGRGLLRPRLRQGVAGARRCVGARLPRHRVFPAGPRGAGRLRHLPEARAGAPDACSGSRARCRRGWRGACLLSAGSGGCIGQGLQSHSPAGAM